MSDDQGKKTALALARAQRDVEVVEARRDELSRAEKTAYERLQEAIKARREWENQQLAAARLKLESS